MNDTHDTATEAPHALVLVDPDATHDRRPEDAKRKTAALLPLPYSRPALLFGSTPAPAGAADAEPDPEPDAPG